MSSIVERGGRAGSGARSCAAAAAFAAALALGCAAPAAAQGGPTAVVVEEVAKATLAETEPVIGQFVAAVEARVAARSSGVVAEVGFEVGDRVASGQVIVRLDATLPRIAKAQAEAAARRAEAGIAESQARLTLAEQALARTERLRGSTAFSRGNFEDQQQEVARATSALASAMAEASGAEASIARALYDVTHAEIRAPFDGVALARSANPGEYLAIGAPVATLLDLDNLEIEIDAPTTLVDGLTPGSTLRATATGGGAAREFEAVVRAVIPRESVATRTRPVRLSVLAADKTALDAAPGGSVTVFAPTSAPREIVAAPKDALVQSRGGWIVYVVAEKDGGVVAEPRTVEIGSAFGPRIEIRSGVAAGDLVVVRGNERLRPGQAIAPTRADGSPAFPPPAAAPPAVAPAQGGSAAAAARAG